MKKYNYKKISKPKQFLTAVFLLIMLSGIIVPLKKKIKINLFANEEVRLIENKLKKVEQENSKLKELIAYFNTSEYIEEQARLNLNYRKEEEKVAIIYGQNNDTEQNENNTRSSFESKNNVQAKNNPNRWWQYFFNKYQ